MAPTGRPRRRPGVTIVLAVLAALAGLLTVVLVWLTGPVAPATALSARTVAAYVEAADRLAARYVDQAWCTPMLAGTTGTVVEWPRRLATPTAAPRLEAGPPRGRVPSAPAIRLLDMSDARAVLPAPGRAWRLTPGFCVSVRAYPRLVTSGGRSRAVYPPLPHHLESLDQIFNRFPRYLGRVTALAVPVTLEVSYALSVDGGAPGHFHLSWSTTLGMVPAGPRHALRIDTWALGARVAAVTVRRDAPAGPTVVHPSPPGSGP